VQRNHQLPEVVLALDARGGLANATGRREHEADQDRDDGDNDQNFDQSQSAAC
jgi:hypothetical protein